MGMVASGRLGSGSGMQDLRRTRPRPTLEWVTMCSETAISTSVKNPRIEGLVARTSAGVALLVVALTLVAWSAVPGVASAATLAQKQAEANRVATQVSALESDV